MFTGIVDHCGVIEKIEHYPEYAKIAIHTQFEELMAGESIAVDGICLTVVESESQRFHCDLSQETLSVTQAHAWQKGRAVNLERSMRLQDRIGGHFVLGHVDTTFSIVQKQQIGEFIRIIFTGMRKEHLPYLI